MRIVSDIDHDITAAQQLIVLRGVPGSGKTTFARTLAAALGRDALVIAADDWFDMNRGGIFDASRLSDAHAWCRSETEKALSAGRSVVVHNTCTTERELTPYVELAETHGARLTVLVVENRHGGRSVHGVPEATVEKMRARLHKSIML